MYTFDPHNFQDRFAILLVHLEWLQILDGSSFRPWILRWNKIFNYQPP